MADLLTYVAEADAPDDALTGPQLHALKKGVRAAIDNRDEPTLGAPGDLRPSRWAHQGIGVSIYYHRSGIVVISKGGTEIVTTASVLDNLELATAKFHATTGQATIANDEAARAGE